MGGNLGGNPTSHTPAHNLLLPLLPSGPGGVHRSLLRGDRLGHHCTCTDSRAAIARGAHYHHFALPLQGGIYHLPF